MIPSLWSFKNISIIGKMVYRVSQKKLSFRRFQIFLIFLGHLNNSGPPGHIGSHGPFWAILDPLGHSGPFGPFCVLWASVEQLLFSYMNANANREDARFNFYCIYASRHTTKILCTQVKWNEAGAVTYRLLQPLPLSKDTDTISFWHWSKAEPSKCGWAHMNSMWHFISFFLISCWLLSIFVHIILHWYTFMIVWTPKHPHIWNFLNCQYPD